MENMLCTMYENRELIAVMGGIIGVAVYAFCRRLKKKRRTTHQSIRSGDDSTNIQAGGDVNYQNMDGGANEK